MDQNPSRPPRWAGLDTKCCKRFRALACGLSSAMPNRRGCLIIRSFLRQPHYTVDFDIPRSPLRVPGLKNVHVYYHACPLRQHGCARSFSATGSFQGSDFNAILVLSNVALRRTRVQVLNRQMKSAGSKLLGTLQPRSSVARVVDPAVTVVASACARPASGA